ncbi:hydroxymethylbilane synthase [Actinomyces dentalis]|uniref:hydroxymethylbilane synthase n=1 Tax=Actinomyces dentalis TaxID=272548 RepID=UPI0028E9FB7C|nr:hydroxymethylbilane synthase [Actinomyces dentalis]
MSTNTSTGAGAGALTVRLGTRASALALAQSRMVARDLRAAAARAGAGLRVELVTVRTRGDVDPTALARLGGAGVFAAALRTALLDGECDLAVHSFKDLPTADAPGLVVAAVPAREDPRDALCLRPPGRAGSGGRADRGPGAGRAGADHSTASVDPAGSTEAPGPAGLTGPDGPAGLTGLDGLDGSTDLTGLGGLTGLRPGARVGTGSPRRAAQLLSIRPDLEIVEIRGNVPTRLARVVGSVVSPDGPMGAVREPDLDAVVLALAGLRRLGLEAYASRILAAAPAGPARTARPGEPADRPGCPGRTQCADHSARPGPARSAGADPEPIMVPAPAQGALAVETREDVATRLPGLAVALAALDDPPTRAAVTAERSLMAHLGAGCAAPVGALARPDDGGGSGGDGDGSAARLRLDALVASLDGARQLVVREAGFAREAEALGARAARSLLEAGAAGIADLRAGRAGGSTGRRR